MLKIIESETGKAVYTLLLNVDFIPLIGNIVWPEWIEFSFHLLVSFAISFSYFYLLSNVTPAARRPLVTALLLTLPAVLLYFPLSYLAIKPVPDLMDQSAFIYWTLGHIVYAYALFSWGNFYQKKHRAS
nr:hypothetical protein [Bacillus ectoiniformans]